MLLAVDFAYYTNFVVIGIVVGSIYALYGLGLTITYKASRLPNFAHGAIGVVGAYGFYKTWRGSTLPEIHKTIRLGLPWIGQWEFRPPQLPLVPALLIGIGAAVLLSVALERLVMRQFAEAPMINKIIASIGLLVILQGLLVDMSPYEDSVAYLLPDPYASVPGFPLWGSKVYFSQEMALVLVVAIGLTALLIAFFRFSTMGVAIRAVADSREVSRLLGVNANRVASTAWAISGALAGIAGILLTPRLQLNALALTGLLVKGFTASLFGGFTSVGGTFAGGIVLGVGETLLPNLPFPPFKWLTDSARNGGNPADFVTLALILVLLLWRPRFAFRNLRIEEDTGVGLSRARSTVPPEDQIRHGLARQGLLTPLIEDWRMARWIMGITLLGGILIFPQFVTSNYWNTVMILGVFYALVSLSIVVCTGWTGQISLAPIAFVGGGCFFAGYLSNHGWNFFFFLPAAGVFGLAMALVIGLPALRLKGFFLALATLAFAFTTERWLLLLPVWQGTQTVRRDPLPVGSDAAVFYVGLTVSIALFVGLWQLRRTRTARAFFAIRDSERTAVAMGIDPTKYKLLAFAISGFIGGIAGGIFGMMAQTFNRASFLALYSISYLTNTVVGGVAQLAGPLFVAFNFGVLPEMIRTEATGINNVPLILGGFFAILTVLTYPAGFTAFLQRLVRPFNAALEFEAWNRGKEAHAPAEDDEAAVAALDEADADDRRFQPVGGGGGGS